MGYWGTAFASALAACCAAALAACGDDGPRAVETADPAAAFAPAVLVHPDERWGPMGVEDFLRDASLWFSDPPRCGDRKIAVGRNLRAQRTARTDWIVPEGLGGKGIVPYYRNPEAADTCEPDFDTRFYAIEMTRPFARAGRPEGLDPTDGFFLDLRDGARAGVDLDAPAYAETARAEVGGQDGLRITYWMLFGAAEVPEAGGAVRDGDWQRVDVLVARDGKAAYVPHSVRVHSAGRTEIFPWDALSAVEGGGSPGASHPVLSSALGTHALSAEACESCRSWRTWTALAPARRQPWYGFGGAWGRIGTSAATTGPAGPHGSWPVRRKADAGDAREGS